MIDVILPTFFLILFNFDVQCRAVPFIYVKVFQEDLKQVSGVGGGWWEWKVTITCFIVMACLIAVNFFRLLLLSSLSLLFLWLLLFHTHNQCNYPMINYSFKCIHIPSLWCFLFLLLFLIFFGYYCSGLFCILILFLNVFINVLCPLIAFFMS